MATPTNTNQNTNPAGSDRLIPLTGNATLDSIFGYANVGVVGAANIFGLYEGIKERKTLLDIAKLNALKAPDQSLPASQATTPADYLSTPDRAQKLFLYAGLGALLLSGAWVAFKKA